MSEFSASHENECVIPFIISSHILVIPNKRTAWGSIVSEIECMRVISDGHALDRDVETVCDKCTD